MSVTIGESATSHPHDGLIVVEMIHSLLSPLSTSHRQNTSERNGNCLGWGNQSLLPEFQFRIPDCSWSLRIKTPSSLPK